jgi:hypothetical protein
MPNLVSFESLKTILFFKVNIEKVLYNYSSSTIQFLFVFPVTISFYQTIRRIILNHSTLLASNQIKLNLAMNF